MSGGMSMDEINEILASRPKRGRPLERDKWGQKMLEVLRKYPDGLEPQELQEEAGLAPHQVGGGAKWMREHAHDGPPVLYVPTEHKWYAANSWPEHMKPGLRSVFGQRAASLVLSLEQLAAQAEDEGWPESKRMIRRVIRDANRVREDVEDLVTELA